MRVSVRQSVRSFLRFFFWRSPNLASTDVYKKQRHAFEARNLPACAHFASQQTAKVNTGSRKPYIKKRRGNFFLYERPTPDTGSGCWSSKAGNAAERNIEQRMLQRDKIVQQQPQFVREKSRWHTCPTFDRNVWRQFQSTSVRLPLEPGIWRNFNSAKKRKPKAQKDADREKFLSRVSRFYDHWDWFHQSL